MAKKRTIRSRAACDVDVIIGKGHTLKRPKRSAAKALKSVRHRCTWRCSRPQD